MRHGPGLAIILGTAAGVVPGNDRFRWNRPRPAFSDGGEPGAHRTGQLDRPGRRRVGLLDAAGGHYPAPPHRPAGARKPDRSGSPAPRQRPAPGPDPPPARPDATHDPAPPLPA